MPPQVLFVATQFSQGGAERYLYEVVRHLRDQWWPVEVLTRQRGVQNQYYYQKLRELNVPMHHAIPRLYSLRTKYPSAYRHAVGRRLIDRAAQAPLAGASITGLMRRFDLICCVQIENYLLVQPYIPAGAKCIIHLMSNAFQYDHDVYAACDVDRRYRFVMTDPTQRQDVDERIAADAEFRFVPFGIDVNGIERVEPDIASSEPRIGVFMRLSPERPLEPLFYCFQSLQKRRGGTLHVYGGGDPRQFDRVLRMLRLTDSVIFEGHAVDMPAVVRRERLSMGWMTSHNEILGYASIELAAMGLPLITWNLGEASRAQILDGTDGALNAFDNVVDFVNCAGAMLSDPLRVRRLADAMRAYVRDTNGIEAVGRQLIDYYLATAASPSDGLVASRRD
jgi:glycosyltransferase involved in cell wall biosynthesis